MKFGVIVFPGSNCDHDAFYTIGSLMKKDVTFLWHKDHSLQNVDVVIVPGGFSYGDYLRAGAIARFSPIMDEVIAFAKKGGLVWGICNGFQILTEAGLLPGALTRNQNRRFICKYVNLKTENFSTKFTNSLDKDQILNVPIAHAEGNFFASDDTIKRIEDNGQVVFRYCDKNGNVTQGTNPNGSINNIAGIVNEKGNVLGMMPHPERCADEILKNTDGAEIFKSLVAA